MVEDEVSGGSEPSRDARPGRVGKAADGSTVPRPPRPIMPLFAEAARLGRPLYVCAPMVRYSKLPFRLLVQQYGVDITWTPMILAHEFIRHPFARDSDFTTHEAEGPLIAQFASNEPTEFARAAALIGPWVDGVDLNCGCPQSWALKEGIGCSLMADPSLVRDMVHAAKQAVGHNKTVSIKIRIHKDIQETVRFLRIVSESDVDFVTVHARTRSQRSNTPPHLEALMILKSHFPSLPMIANGDVYSLADAHRIAAATSVQGVMAARGLLENPCLFAGHEKTPHEAVIRMVAYAAKAGLRIELLHYHLTEMMSHTMSKQERKALMACRDLVEVTDWLDDTVGTRQISIPRCR